MKSISIQKASLINAVSQYTSILLYIVFNAVMSRLLTPEEFGIFAVVTIFTTLFSKIYDSGFGAAIIQQKDLVKKDISSIYTFMCIVGLALAALFLLLGFPVAAVYKNGVFVRICAILAVAVLFNTMSVVPNSYLLREKDFLKVAIINIVNHFTSYALAIVFALMGMKYYALALQVVVLAVMKFLLSRWLSGIPAARRIDRAPIRKVLPFTLYEIGSMLINFLEQNSDNILISLTMGSTPLGFYSKAYTLSRYPVDALSGAVTPTLHPILSDYQNDHEAMHRKYMRFLMCMSVIGAFVSAVCFCAAREIILIIYGSQWEGSIQSFRYMSLCIYALFMMAGNISIYKSLNRMDLLFRAVIINTSVTCASIVAGVLMGSIEAVAIWVSVAYWSNMLITLFILNHIGFGVSYAKFWKAFLPDVAMMFLLMLVSSACEKFFLTAEGLWLPLIEKAAVLGVLYLAYLLLTGRYRDMLTIFIKKKKRQ